MEDRSADAKDSKNTAGSSLVQFYWVRVKTTISYIGLRNDRGLCKLVLFSVFVEPLQILS